MTLTTPDALDPVALRCFIYDEILNTGLPPRSGRIGAHFGVTPDAARTALAALRIGKTVLLYPDRVEIRMAGPFASAPTPYVVTRGAQQWWANCAWDMLGVAAIVGAGVRLEASCTDCGDPFSVDYSQLPNMAGEWVVHFLRPARRWYEDIGFT